MMRENSGRENRTDLRRRQVLGALGLLPGAGFAGCTAVSDRVCRDVPYMDRVCEDGEGGYTPDEQDVISAATTAHVEYRQQTEPVNRSTRTLRDGIDARQTDGNETASVIAEPADNNNGDRIVVTPPESANLDRVMLTLVAFWGSPIDETLVTTSVFDREVTFIGGEGQGLVVAAGTTDIPDEGNSVLAVRAQNVDDARELATTFESGIGRNTIPPG